MNNKINAILKIKLEQRFPKIKFKFITLTYQSATLEMNRKSTQKFKNYIKKHSDALESYIKITIHINKSIMKEDKWDCFAFNEHEHLCNTYLELPIKPRYSKDTYPPILEIISETLKQSCIINENEEEIFCGERLFNEN